MKNDFSLSEKNMKKEKILCTYPWYYTITKSFCVTIRVEIRLKENIDGDALRRAVDITMKRYPYLGKRLRKSWTRYYIVRNSLPVVVKENEGKINLGGKEANYHQFAFTYSGNSIFLNQTHGIFDGRGSYPFLQTLLHYYCQFCYGENYEDRNVNYIDTPINPEEYADPYLHWSPKSDKSFRKAYKPCKALKLEKEGLVTPSAMQYRRILINEAELMHLCKSSDASPNTALSVLLCRAIRKLHPEATLPIIPSLFCDARPAFDSSISHYSLAAPLCISYDNRMDTMDFSLQNTIFRGKLMVVSDASAMQHIHRQMKRAYEYMNLLPTLKSKLLVGKLCRKYSFNICTFFISYARNSSFGGCDRHIELFSPLLYMQGSGLSLEISTVDGNFLVTWLQEWKEDVYLDAFLRECDVIGLKYILSDRGEFVPLGYLLE